MHEQPTSPSDESDSPSNMSVRSRYKLPATADPPGSSMTGGSKDHSSKPEASCKPSSQFKTNVWVVILGMLVGGSITFFSLRPSISFFGSGDDCQITLGSYHGREADPDRGLYGSPVCLVNTKFLKVTLHKVKLPGMKQIINDWIFIDYHDRVNVLVQTSEQEFLVFEQTKYALEKRISLAIVGGIVEPGEDPRNTARREVEEELDQACQDFHFLGRFVTDVNRGMGWLNAFLATGCNTINQHKLENNEGDNQVGASDTEVQVIKHISLDELREAFSAGRFLEAQWTATIGLSLAHPSLQQKPRV